MSRNTNEIRTDLNWILDCIDYVCSRLDISQEELDKAVKFFEDEVLAPGIKLCIKNVLDDRVGKNRYDWNPAVRRYEKPKVPHAAKDDWSYELDHLYFDTLETARKFKHSLIDLLDTYDAITVSDVYDLMNETAPFDAHFYGWQKNDIYGKIKIESIELNSAQVILPPPVRLTA